MPSSSASALLAPVRALTNPFWFACSYAPAFFLQKLVHFLETRQDRASRGDVSLHWGYVYCVGLLVGSVLEALVSGQLWFGALALTPLRC